MLTYDNSQPTVFSKLLRFGWMYVNLREKSGYELGDIKSSCLMRFNFHNLLSFLFSRTIQSLVIYFSGLRSEGNPIVVGFPKPLLEATTPLYAYTYLLYSSRRGSQKGSELILISFIPPYSAGFQFKNSSLHCLKKKKWRQEMKPQ